MKLRLLAPILLAACTTSGVADPAVPDPGVPQIHEALRQFAIANEWHYYDHREFTADVTLLRTEYYDWPWADSVEITVTMGPMNQYWSATATHLRIGKEKGCAIHVGDAEPISSPGGVWPDRVRGIACDEVMLAEEG